MVVLLILEEGLVGADDLGVLAEAVPDAVAEVDDALNAVGGQEGVAENLFGLLPDAVDAASALDESDDGPGQIVVDDDGAVLEVLALAEDVGCDEDAQLLVGSHACAPPVADGAEPLRHEGGVCGAAGDGGHGVHALGVELGFEVGHGVGELREDEHLLVRERPGQERVEGRELGVARRVPGAVGAEQAEERVDVGLQLGLQFRAEEAGAEPVEAPLVLACVLGVYGGGAGFEGGSGQRAAGLLGFVPPVFLPVVVVRVKERRPALRPRR